MSFDQLRYELRLLGKPVFLTPPLVLVGFVLLLAIVNRGISVVNIARSIGGVLEILLPMSVGVVVATVATHDRAIELQLTLPRKYHRTASARFLFIVLWSGIVSLLTSLFLALFNYWRMPGQIVNWNEPGKFLIWQLTWLSPMLWLMACALVLSLFLRSRMASGALICVLSLTEIIAHDTLNTTPLLQPFYLFLLTFSPGADYWLVNRIELLGMAAILLLLAWFLLRRPELLLAHASGEE